MNPSTERKFSNRIFLGNVWVRPLSGGSPLAANAVSLNRGGLTLFCSRFLEVGQTVELMLRGRSAGDFTFQGQVTQVRVDTEGNMIDFTFTRVLSNEEMQVLETKLGIKVRQ
jgi:hypothetical protein